MLKSLISVELCSYDFAIIKNKKDKIKKVEEKLMRLTRLCVQTRLRNNKLKLNDLQFK